MNRVDYILIACVVAFGAVFMVQAADETWDGDTDATWSNIANWFATTGN